MERVVLSPKKQAGLIKLVAKIVAARKAELANLALAGLRIARDETPDEWDALMRSKSGPIIASLWDLLVEVSEEVEVSEKVE